MVLFTSSRLLLKHSLLRDYPGHHVSYNQHVLTDTTSHVVGQVFLHKAHRANNTIGLPQKQGPYNAYHSPNPNLYQP